MKKEEIANHELKHHKLLLWLCRNIEAKNIIYLFVISFCFAFMYGYIIPLDIMLNNQSDLIIGFFSTARYMIFPAILIFSVMAIVMFVALAIDKRIFTILSVLTCSLTIASCVQELFMNGYMVRGNGNTFVGDISQNYTNFNMYIYTLITILPATFLLYVSFKKDKHNKFINYKTIEQASLYIVSAVTIMRFTGFFTSYISYAPKEHVSNNESYICSAYGPTLSFSKDNNIYVFIVDTFDSYWCDELLEEYPELCQELDGFTYYKNNISHYTNTFPSIASMLTYSQYDNSAWDSFLNEAWNKENFLLDLKNNGYRINLIMDRANVYYEADDIVKNIADNFETVDEKDIIVNKEEYRKLLYKLMFSRILPYFLKNVFNDVLIEMQHNSYFEFAYHDYSSPSISCYSDCQLYDYVINNDFNSDSQDKVFTIIHLHGAHDPNPNLIKSTGVTEKKQATVRANFEIILHYMNQAKELGIYDKSTFIILGDHARSVERLYDSNDVLAKPAVTSLMIKPAGTDRAMLKFDDDHGLSNDMFSASVLDYAGIPHEQYGFSYQDIINSGEEVVRKFDTYSHPGFGAVRFTHSYLVSGNARDISNWKIVK